MGVSKTTRAIHCCWSRTVRIRDCVLGGNTGNTGKQLVDKRLLVGGEIGPVVAAIIIRAHRRYPRLRAGHACKNNAAQDIGFAGSVEEQRGQVVVMMELPQKGNFIITLTNVLFSGIVNARSPIRQRKRFYSSNSIYNEGNTMSMCIKSKMITP